MLEDVLEYKHISYEEFEIEMQFASKEIYEYLINNNLMKKLYDLVNYTNNVLNLDVGDFIKISEDKIPYNIKFFQYNNKVENLVIPNLKEPQDAVIAIECNENMKLDLIDSIINDIRLQFSDNLNVNFGILINKELKDNIVNVLFYSTITK